MNIIACTTTFWNDQAQAEKASVGQLGLLEWYSRIQRLFSPKHIFLACGTYSNPGFSPFSSGIPIINSGVEQGEAYDTYYRQYALCAMTAAMAYALNRHDWEFMVMLDPDTLVGAVNFPKLFAEFQQRPEVCLSNQWWNNPGGPFIVLKRKGAAMFLHQRSRPNIITSPQATPPLLGEQEMGVVFKGVWWDPWPHIANVRQDYSVRPNNPKPLEALAWPFVRQPHPDLVEPYLKTQWPKAIPL